MLNFIILVVIVAGLGQVRYMAAAPLPERPTTLPAPAETFEAPAPIPLPNPE